MTEVTEQGRAEEHPLEARPQVRARPGWGSDRIARLAFIWPALLVILFVSVFPLIVSLFLSLSRLDLVRGGFQITFIGLGNFRDLLFGSDKTEFLGLSRSPSPLGWAVIVAGIGAVAWALLRAARARPSVAGLVLRGLLALLAASLLWLIGHTLFGQGGYPGTVVVTLVYVVAGITLPFIFGLGLAYLVTQQLPGQRLFRVVFLLPLMITPVGIAYMFRMLADTDKGPFEPVWAFLGLGNFSWVTSPWGARAAVMVGDIWQWTPFMFIVLLAALESQDIQTVEAATVDGANRWQVFRHITMPAILPISLTVILIRMIEAFKIIDLPNVLTNGGPGTATESVTLQAYIRWRSLDLGSSAATAYSLLFIVTVAALAFINLLRRSVAQE